MPKNNIKIIAIFKKVRGGNNVSKYTRTSSRGRI